jgi:hypothetical protein
MDGQRESRTGLRFLVDDLGSAVALPQLLPPPVDAGGGAGAQQRRTRFWVETPGDAFSSARMAFLTSVPDERPRASGGGAAPAMNLGDLRLVLYAVVLTPDGGASGLAPGAASQKLVRREFTSAATYERVTNHLTLGTPLVNPADWSLLEQQGAAAMAGGLNAVVAHDVIRFEARPLRDLTGPPPVGIWDEREMPAWVEVTLRVTNRQTGRWLQTQADWTGQGERAAQITNSTPDIYTDDPEVQTYMARIRLPAFPL